VDLVEYITHANPYKKGRGQGQVWQILAEQITVAWVGLAEQITLALEPKGSPCYGVQKHILEVMRFVMSIIH